MAATLNSIAPGGIAVNAAGHLADMPRELASNISHELFNVITLLHAAMACNDSNDTDELTDNQSRRDALVFMADKKVREQIQRLTPFA